MRSKTDYRLVYVEWEDSQVGTAGWGFTEGVKPSLATVRSVGWLVYDGKDCKMIVPHLSKDDTGHIQQQGCGDITIPTSAVRKMVTVRVPSKS